MIVRPDEREGIIKKEETHNLSEVKLRESEERYRILFDRASDGIFVLSIDGKLVSVNESFARMHGYTKEEMVGISLSSLDAPETSRRVPERMRRILAGETVVFEVEHYHKDGYVFPLEVSASRVSIDGAYYIQAFHRDITERKHGELALQHNRAEIAHLSRVATMGELTASVAHELNQPLGAILSNTEAAELLLKADRPDLGEIGEILADIRKDDQRANEVIQRIRMLLRKREFKSENINLNSSVEDAIKFLLAEAHLRRVRLVADLPPDLPTVRGDRVQLQQILLNLILNGMDAMKGGLAKGQQLIIRAARKEKSRVEVAVTDAGTGIPADCLARIFDPFFTTKREGLGMGLAICRTIAEVHGGRIWAENNPNGGATFYFTVPVAENERDEGRGMREGAVR